MAANPVIVSNINEIRTATYGRDMREAIASAIELCYNANSGEVAIEAAERANSAAAAVEAIIGKTQAALDDLESSVSNFNEVVRVSEDQPTSSYNKIWIQPQEDAEYKVATFEAYEVLWNRCNEIAGTYQQGHGGVVSILRDEEYDGLDEETGAVMNRYVVTYSDGTTGEFFMRDGQRGEVGPVDSIVDTKPYYAVQTDSNYTGIPPTYPDDGWVDNMPTVGKGEYLWTVTIVTYASGAKSYVYGLTRFGLDGNDGADGDGQVNTVSIGDSATAIQPDSETKNLVLPIDDAPTEGSTNLMTSGGIYAALQNNTISFENTALTGIPTAPTANVGTETTQIATTEFVRKEIKDLVPGYAIDGIWLLIATMSTQQLIYQNSWITESVAAFCATSEPVEWTTTEGQITIKLAYKPSSSITFPLLLVKRRE